MWGLLKAAGLALAVANLKRRIRALAVKGALAAAGLFTAIVALCFFLVALHVLLSSAVGSAGSAAIIGGVFLVAAFILFFVASRPTRIDNAAPSLEAAGKGSEQIWTRLTQSATSGESPLTNPVFQAAALALLAGVFLGRRRSSQEDHSEDED